MLRQLYDWMLYWAKTPYGDWALGLIAFAESSFFPLPPDPLLIALALGAPDKALWYATICSLASVAGGVLGYMIGRGFMEVIGKRILRFYGAEGKWGSIQNLFERYDGWAVGIAAFTPIPYKVFTIAAGAFRINFRTFLIASIIGRAGRFFLVAGLIYLYGNSIRLFIDKYFNVLSLSFVALLLLGFIVIRFALKRHRKARV